MHGRPRVAQKPEDEKASAAKAAKLRELQSQFLFNHHNKIYEKEALDLSGKLLEVNPEFYTAWNYRKLAVNYHLGRSEHPDPESVQTILKEELQVVESALRQNYKSYGAWHHRKWVLSKGHSSVDHELRLLAKFQKADSRNFHAWNYRRFIAALKKIPDEDEFKYTTDMIESNFSNYSAWHNRSILLTNLLKRRAEGFFPKEKILNEEYDYVHQAIFTDPDDQSGWFYHLWLLKQTVRLDAPQLMSCWPAPGTKLVISANQETGDRIVLPLGSFHYQTQSVPMILYFDKPVTGVNSSTVGVKSPLAGKNELIWRPLSVNQCKSHQAWVADLCFDAINISSSDVYPVEISLGGSHGIKSLNGVDLSQTFQCEFSVSILPQHLNRQAEGMVSWNDSDFQKYDTALEESSPLLSFDQLGLSKREAGASKWNLDIVKSEIELFRELLSEFECKIGKLMLARLLTALDTVIRSGDPTLTSEIMVDYDEVLGLYSDLMKSDPKHSEYYKDEHSLAFLHQITSRNETLLRYCYSYSPSSPPDGVRLICLRLNNLSLTKIGSVDRFLWVQMLDLSHNELGTTEGLEALQLLSYLNMRNNKLKSFTALDSLRHLKTLRVLDISYNEIGRHPTDTTRYLCSSPLSHSAGSEWNMKELTPLDGIGSVHFWEAFSVFKDLNLTQLSVAGNQGVDGNKLRSFLLKVMPSLRWLDGESVH